MRRRAALAVLAAVLVLPAAADAHPLGNFSINHQARVAVSADRVDVTYILDQAEIPTFQERGRRRAAVVARKRAEIVRGLALEVGGRRVPLRPGAAEIAFPRGQGGLPTTRLELPLAARVATVGRTVRLRDRTFAGRVGWKAIVAVPGRGTAVRSSVPAGDPTARLTRYPRGLLDDPPDQREAVFAVRAGTGTVTAPRADGSGTATTRSGNDAGAEDGFAGLLGDGAAGLSLLLLAAAFGWGAVHALSPGHGKAMVAAYLVGTRGTPRHAVALGLTVTVTHTIGVFALGVVTLALSAWIVPEDLYPWLNLVAGVLVVGVGAGVLRRRLRHRHAHHHHHHHHPDISRRGLLAMGASAGLVPCPSALVVLLAAIAQHQVALGLVLIVAFSAGLAATLTALGLAVVHSGRLLGRLPLPGSAVASLPAASALLIVAVGSLLTLRALSGIV
jgi:ABC-type nickel/cobalt efflux system permease component RcnA